MKHFPRLVSKANSVTALSSVAALGSLTILIGSAALAQRAYAVQLLGVMPENSAFMVHSSQGYLGIEMRDIDSERAAALKLKDPAGVEIVVVDHDAPAGKVGLRVHDVILQMNGQQVQGVEQLRRMLRETPPGRAVSLLISRDGQQQAINVQLADRAKIEQDAWTQIQTIHDPDDNDSSFALVAPSGHSAGSGFFGALTFGSPSLGVELDPVGSQLADYFGIKDGQGLLVKRVAQNSPASTAGLKAGDVITKVNGEATPTLNSWAKTIHANRGKQVQVTIVRNHKEQTLNLQAGDAKHKGELLIPDFDWYNDRSKLEESLPQFEAQLTETINPAILAEETRQAISGIDAEALAEQARDAVKSLNMPELQREMQDEQQQIERDMKSLQKDLESLRFPDMN
jgi:serine protease Do